METNQRIGNLDVIKILAASGILFHHYQQLAAVKLGGVEFYGGRFAFGYLVELFFIISGFLTAYSFNSEKKFKTWIIGKVIRYYPYAFIACIFSLLIALVYFFIVGDSLFGMDYNFPTILTSLTLFHTGWFVEYSPAVNNPTWYLCVLTICYLLYWLLQKVILWKNKWVLFGGTALIMIPLYYVVTHGVGNIPFLRLSNISGYGSFFVGCSLCLIYKQVNKRVAIICNIILWIATIGGIVVLGLSNWYVLTYLFFPSMVLSALLIPQLESELLKTIGAISFELYLWHVPVYSVLLTLITVFKVRICHTYYTMFFFYILSWIIAAVVYYVIEKRLAKKLKGFLKN